MWPSWILPNCLLLHFIFHLFFFVCVLLVFLCFIHVLCLVCVFASYADKMRRKVPIGYNGTPQIHPKTAPFPSTITTPI